MVNSVMISIDPTDYGSWVDVRNRLIIPIKHVQQHHSWMRQNWTEVFGTPFDVNLDSPRIRLLEHGFLRAVYQRNTLCVEGHTKWVKTGFSMLLDMSSHFRTVMIDYFDVRKWEVFHLHESAGYRRFLAIPKTLVTLGSVQA